MHASQKLDLVNGVASAVESAAGRTSGNAVAVVTASAVAGASNAMKALG